MSLGNEVKIVTVMKQNDPDSCHLLLDSDDNRGNQTETSSVISSSSQSNHELNPFGKRVRETWNHPSPNNVGFSNPNILFSPSRGFKTGLNLTSDNLNQRMVSRFFNTTSSSSSEGNAGSNDDPSQVTVCLSGVTGDAINVCKKKKKDSILKSLTSDNRGDEKSPAGDDRRSQESSIEISGLNLSTAKGCRGNHHTFPQSFLHQNLSLHPVPPSSSQEITSVPSRVPSKVTSQVLFSPNCVWTTCSCNR